jgi:hypothetical protein
MIFFQMKYPFRKIISTTLLNICQENRWKRKDINTNLAQGH